VRLSWKVWSTTPKRSIIKHLPIIEVCCAVIVKDELILAAQRGTGMPHPHKWEFPGGKLKTGEKPENCIIREIREELGVQIKVWQLLPSVVHTEEQRIIQLIPFICQLAGEEDFQLSEHEAVSWIDRDRIREIDWLEADIKVVDQLLNR